MALRGGAALAACIGRRRSRSSSMLLVPAFLFTNNHNPASRNIIHTDLGIVSYHYPNSGFTYRTKAIQGTTTETVPPNNDSDVEQQPSNGNWKIKMLYDGDCPLCMREVNMLKERNKNYGTINFVDISSDKYSPEENHGLDYETVMGRIHAILSDGTVVTDVEAFRKLYEAVGLGWVYAITKYEPIATVADAVYGVWAKYRLQVTGRPPLEEVLEARRKSKEEVFLTYCGFLSKSICTSQIQVCNFGLELTVTRNVYVRCQESKSAVSICRKSYGCCA